MTIEGTVIINDGVVASIAAQAVEEVEGVSSVGTASVTRSVAEALGAARSQTRGVSVQVGRTEAAFDLNIIVEYGYTIPDVVAQVKENVVRQVQTLTGLKVKRVNITVSDIQAPERSGQGIGIELQ